MPEDKYSVYAARRREGGYGRRREKRWLSIERCKTGSRGPVGLIWCALEMRSVTSLARDHVPGEQRGGGRLMIVLLCCALLGRAGARSQVLGRSRQTDGLERLRRLATVRGRN